MDNVTRRRALGLGAAAACAGLCGAASAGAQPLVALGGLNRRAREKDPFIVYCGNACKPCPQYQKKECPGCRVDGFNRTKCAVRDCNRAKKQDNCGVCDEYPCSKLTAEYEKWTRNGFGPGAIQARGILDAVHDAHVNA